MGTFWVAQIQCETADSSNYALGVFSLKDAEALIVTLDTAPSGVYWSLQLGDVWSRSLPFGERQTSLNNAQVKVDADGAIRVVISNRDPGIANWLDTVGRHEGTIVFRNYRAKQGIVPRVKKVRFDELKANLPATTPMVAPRQREAALEHRRQAVLTLYGE